MNGHDNNDLLLAAFISVNRQLVAHGEKDRLRKALHESLKSSGIRAQLENQVRQSIQQQNGGVNNVNVEEISKQLGRNLPAGTQEASGAIIEQIIGFTQERARD